MSVDYPPIRKNHRRYFHISGPHQNKFLLDDGGHMIKIISRAKTPEPQTVDPWMPGASGS